MCSELHLGKPVFIRSAVGFELLALLKAMPGRDAWRAIPLHLFPMSYLFKRRPGFGVQSVGMTETQFRDKMRELVGDQQMKVWLTKTVGHRLEFIWSVGRAQMEQEQQIARQGKYFLVGQKMPPELIPSVVNLFEQFANSDEIKNQVEVDRRIRLTGQF